MGTRPEVIKMFPVVDALRRAGVDARLIHLGQHLELSSDAFEAFGLTADIDLAVMTAGQTPSGVASRVLDRLGPVLDELLPSWLVQGDTTTVLAAAIATAHFAPTSTAADALRGEGVPAERVTVTGNTVIDALRWACDRLPPAPLDPALADLDPTRPLILLTTHRRENFGAGLVGVFSAVRRIGQRRPDVQFLFPVHPNPAVRAEAQRCLGPLPWVTMTRPLGYLDLARVLSRCSLVLTDSGGLQEEAPALGKQVLVLREVTERPEAITVGMARLVGTDPDLIVASVLTALDHPVERPTSPYGDGRAGQRIADALLGRPVEPFRALAAVA
ncbi:MAG: non-hydrolyzing UDP-N-acetylglucosamine 2-epimerase [Acidimicrobiales bacterium]